MEQRQLHLLGVSFRTAPAAVREALSFNEQQIATLLRDSGRECPELEVAILSTCNRSEFYLVTPQDGNYAHEWLLRLRRLRPSAQILRDDCLLYQERGSAAAIHLFRVACGLDSAILGDVQILGQVKRALALAAGAGTVGRTLRQLYQRAIRAGKRAREKTAIGSGAASIGSALASMMANGLLESKNEPNILIIGAGKVARDIAHHFAKRRIGKLTIINRTLAAAMDLAAACGGKSLAWASLPDALVHCHCAIAATAASTPILRWELLERVARARMERPLLVVDTGLPRNVEKGAPVDLIDIDEIREQQAVHLANRLAAVPDVERIVASELQSWQRWVAALPIEEVIKQVYEEASRQSRLTAQQLVQCGPISERHAAEFIQRSYKKLLHAHVQQLRRLSAEIPRGTKYGPAVESPP